MPAATRSNVRSAVGVGMSLLAAAWWIAPAAAQPAARPPEATPRPPARQAPQRPLAELLRLTDAAERMGDAMPTGAARGGVVLGLVEGGGAAWGPDPASSNFTGLDLELVGGPSLRSAHAQKTASILAGRRGIVGGARKLRAYNVQAWMGEAYLGLGSDTPPVVHADTPSVFSHSWVAFDARVAVPIVRRLDFAIDRDDVIHVVGVNNGADTPVPPTLAGAYNAIAVGVDTGASSGGRTKVEVDGRSKPDLVAPGGLTSWATPAVAGVATLARDFLLARDDAVPPAEVVKAALLAGAAKPPGWANDPAAGHPLDEHLGAGRVDADATLRILEGGPLAPGDPIRRVAGYAFAEAPAAGDGTLSWELDLPVDAGPLSLVATWHRRIAARRVRVRASEDAPITPRWLAVPRLANLDLVLERLDADGNVAEEVLASRSRIDNVEHVYLPATPAGRYRVSITRGEEREPWDVALAWRLRPAGAVAIEPAPEPEPEPEPESGPGREAVPAAEPAPAVPAADAPADKPSASTLEP